MSGGVGREAQEENQQEGQAGDGTEVRTAAV
jgi:hypothetical protein